MTACQSLRRAMWAMLAGSVLVVSVCVIDPEHARQVILAKQEHNRLLREGSPTGIESSEPESFLGTTELLAGGSPLDSSATAEQQPSDEEPWKGDDPPMLASSRPGAVPLKLPRVPDTIRPLDPSAEETGKEHPDLPVPNPVPVPDRSVTGSSTFAVQQPPQWEIHLDRIERQLEELARRDRERSKWNRSHGRREVASGQDFQFSGDLEWSRNGTGGVDPVRIEPLDRSGTLWRIEFREAELASALAAMGEVTGWNIVPRGSVEGRLTLRLERISPTDALSAVLRAADLVMEQDGSILWVREAGPAIRPGWGTR